MIFTSHFQMITVTCGLEVLFRNVFGKVHCNHKICSHYLLRIHKLVKTAMGCFANIAIEDRIISNSENALLLIRVYLVIVSLTSLELNCMETWFK